MSSSSLDDGLLQPGWAAHTSPDGETYYYNESTGASVWERPSLVQQQQVGEAAKAEAADAHASSDQKTPLSLHKRLRLNSTNEEDKNRLLGELHNLDAIQDPKFASLVVEWISLGYAPEECAVAAVQNFEDFATQINQLGSWLDLVHPGDSVAMGTKVIQDFFFASLLSGGLQAGGNVGENLETQLDDMLLLFENLPGWLDDLLGDETWLPFLLDLHARVPHSKFLGFCFGKLVSRLGYLPAIASNPKLCAQFFPVFAEAVKRAIVEAHSGEAGVAKLQVLGTSSPVAFKFTLALLSKLQSGFTEQEPSYWIVQAILTRLETHPPSFLIPSSSSSSPCEVDELFASIMLHPQVSLPERCLALSKLPPNMYVIKLRPNHEFLSGLCALLFQGPPNSGGGWSTSSLESKDAALDVLLHLTTALSFPSATTTTTTTTTALTKKALAQISNLSLIHFQLICQDLSKVFDAHSNRKIRLLEQKSFFLAPDLNNPTLAMCMLFYLRGLVSVSGNQTKDLLDYSCKLSLAIGEIHPLHREFVLELLGQLFDILNQHQASKPPMDRLPGGVIIQVCEQVVVQGMVKLLVLGLSTPVLDFMLQHLHQLDFSILRKFFVALFVLAQPPYSDEFREKITALFQCSEVQNLDSGGGEEFIQTKRDFWQRINNNQQ
ncbi:hypothetical protein BASA81_000294 [Batrachochytrium salamandrivorans]|nr:hypothetical protein BASA81_000294 [Batrachochytrium salamandrivorans]